MPKNIVLFKERTLRRAIRAVQKEGLVPKRATVAPDGTMSVSFAEPPPLEVSPELDGEIDRARKCLPLYEVHRELVGSRLWQTCRLNTFSSLLIGTGTLGSIFGDPASSA
jgi:hypothetical protein